MSPSQRLRVPFNRSYWVTPGQLLAGYYPGAESRVESHSKLEALLDCGIRCFINLMEPIERNWFGREFVGYQPQLEELAASSGLEITCLSFPIRDRSVPTIPQMQRILDTIEDYVTHGKPVYLHCLGGIGRTGTVVGCYLIRHQRATAENVLAAIEELRQEDPESFIPSPETVKQREFVVEWAIVEAGKVRRRWQGRWG